MIEHNVIRSACMLIAIREWPRKLDAAIEEDKRLAKLFNQSSATTQLVECKGEI